MTPTDPRALTDATLLLALGSALNELVANECLTLALHTAALADVPDAEDAAQAEGEG